MNRLTKHILKNAKRRASEEETPGSGLYDTKVYEHFAEFIVRETLRITGATPSMAETAKKHLGIEE